jgi:acyl carrier protein
MDRILQIIQKSLKVKDINLITPEKTLDELGADSLDAVEMILSLESEYKITIHDEDFENLKTIRDVVNLINKRIQEPILTK